MAHLRCRATPAAEPLDQIWEKRRYDAYPVDIAKPHSIRAGSVLASQCPGRSTVYPPSTRLPVRRRKCFGSVPGRQVLLDLDISCLNYGTRITDVYNPRRSSPLCHPIGCTVH